MLNEHRPLSGFLTASGGLTDEFALGHLPGALNIPAAELERRLPEIPVDREVIAYCRGVYCRLSFEAVAAPRARGYLVHQIEERYP